ncbi:ABC transporter permease [Nonomuraea pusilla]|uniref:ABC transporter permease n=1 Tax=Nonomuraea pusilla TaxID=46177 RepID=UPI003319A973
MTSVAWDRRKLALGRFWSDFRRQRAGMAGLVVLAVAVVLALIAPLFIDENVTSVVTGTGARWAPPSLDEPFGTDESGRSILLMAWWGSRTSLLIGFLAALLSIVIGMVVGIAAGHFRGWAGAALMRVTDWFLVLPSLVTALVLAAILGGSTFTIIVAIGVTTWPSTARLIRAQTLSVEARPYIERSKALGAGHWHITTRHVLPNVAPLLLASTTLEVASAIVTESTLAFLGASANKTSWGTMLRGSYDYGAATEGAWWYILIPGLCILAVVMAFTVAGRALEAVLNPRLRKAGA